MTALSKSMRSEPPATAEDWDALNPFVPMPRWALWVLLLFGGLYTLVVSSAALYNASQSGISMVWVALSNVWLIFWIFYPLIFYRPAYGWCHPLILLALLGILNMVFRSTGLFMSGLPEHVMLPDQFPDELNRLYAYGNLVNSLALMVLYAGFLWGPQLPLPRLNPAPAPRRSLYLVLLIFLGISLVTFWQYARIHGGIYSHIKHLAFGMSKKIELADGVEGIGQYTVLMNMATVAAVVWVCAQTNAFRNPLFWVVTVTALVMAYLSEGKRSHMIYPAILIMLCWMLRNRKVPYFRLATMGLGAFLLLGLLGLFRSSNWSDMDTVNVHFARDTSLLEVGKGTIDELARRSGSESTYYAILAKVPREESPLYGKTYLEWGLRFIPRELWPDKPRGVDVQANRTFYGGDWGLPAGAVGEAYWNFHIPGVLAVFFLLGVFKRWLADLLIRYPAAPAVMVVYMISLFYFDASQNGFKTWLYSVIPALIMLYAGGMLGRRRSEPQPLSASLEAPPHVA